MIENLQKAREQQQAKGQKLQQQSVESLAHQLDEVRNSFIQNWANEIVS